MFGLWPAWFWILGIWLLILLSHRSWKRTTIIIIAWLIFLFTFSEEWRWSSHIFKSSTDKKWESRHKKWVAVTQKDFTPDTWNENYPFRIISYNVNGNLDALRSVSQYQPDICFFQEVPDSKRITPEILSLFGPKSVYVDGGDCAILSRLPISSQSKLSLKYAGPAVRAELNLSPKINIIFVNVRLLLPELGLNIFSPTVWKATKQTQTYREEQMVILNNMIQTLPLGTQLVIGGDFNRPARAASLHLLRKNYIDTYAYSGIGWGNTMTVDFPVSRIDLIWIPKEWRAVKSRVIALGNSDHRLLISDIDVNYATSERR